MIAECIQERVRFAGPRGVLAGELMYALDARRCAVLLAGPHPYMGGGMNNLLLRHIAEALADAGCVVLRFDYSGTGESEGPDVDVQDAMAAFWATGEAPQDPVLIEDARAAGRWLAAASGLRQVVVGYSFGALAASRVATGVTAGLVLIAPTLRQHAIALPATSSLHCRLIRAGRDFATPAEMTQRWIQSTRPDLTVSEFEEADHFFRGLEKGVADCCAEFCMGLTEDIVR